MSPPIRPAGHNKALQAALASGVLQVSPFEIPLLLDFLPWCKP